MKANQVRLQPRGQGKFVKKIFLTYNGLFEVIRKARSGTADRFKKWANKVVYTAHLGTEEQRDELALEMTGIDYKTLTMPLPGLYLHQIGKMQVMKKVNPQLMHIDTSVGTDHSMHKFGRSNNYFGKRRMDHSRNYPKKFKGTSCKTTCFTEVDEKLLSKAETDLSHFFKAKNKMIELEGEKELVMLTKEDMAEVRAKYTELHKMYGVVGNVNVVLTTQVEQLTAQLEQSSNRENFLTTQLEQSSNRENFLTTQLEQSNIQLEQSNSKLQQHEQNRNVRQDDRLTVVQRIGNLNEEEEAIVTPLFEGLSLLKTSPF